MPEPFYSSLDGQLFTAGPYETREEAVADAPNEFDLETGRSFFTGIQDTPVPMLPEVDWDAVLEQFAGEIHPDVVDDQWPHCSKEQEAELNAELNQVFQAWLTRHQLAPTFFGIRSVVEHQAP